MRRVKVGVDATGLDSGHSNMPWMRWGRGRDPAQGDLSQAVRARSGHRSRVVILATGGTMAAEPNNNSALGYTAGRVSVEELIAAAPGIERLATLNAEQISNIGSQDITERIWFDVVAVCNAILDGGAADGVVITGGTDTLEETAFFIDLVTTTNKPIVLAGSMRPPTALSADGPRNLYAAVQVAASKEARGRGVHVVMNDTIHGPRDVTKCNTTSVETFCSPNTGPVGRVDPASVLFFRPAIESRRPRFTLPANPPLPRVDVIYAHASMPADKVADAVSHGARGIVLAGVGDGNSPSDVIDALADAASAGIVVVRSARVGSGFTAPNVELNDDELGFVASQDLNPAKSRVLLQLLLAKNITDRARVQREFARP